ncbi:hypothetical protein SAMN05660652_01310 [Propionivibrio dicarboxylicus]|uniref:Uncharacterized protein n=1 Tax=Propionivibrio dicarboxylicus TaxID=83767 RepID=A0A1G8A8D0_9RHOO|nr:hypothetical protein SAMN05660652_01310 [Propionivibrio dicarboxylicus]
MISLPWSGSTSARHSPFDEGMPGLRDEFLKAFGRGRAGESRSDASCASNRLDRIIGAGAPTLRGTRQVNHRICEWNVSWVFQAAIKGVRFAHRKVIERAYAPRGKVLRSTRIAEYSKPRCS